MEYYYFIAAAVGIFLVAFFIGWKLNSVFGAASIKKAEAEAEKILKDAEKEAKNLKREKLLEVKDEWLRKKQEFDNEVNHKRQKLLNYEKQLESREENLEKRFELVLEKERETQALGKKIERQREELEKKNNELERLIYEQNIRLEKTAGLTAEEAKKMLMENMVDKARSEASAYIKEIRDKARAEAKQEAQKIVVQAIQRTAVDHAVETTVSVVQLANDDMKGRIIGREGRNIRAFEAKTGVDVIVDDTPRSRYTFGFRPIQARSCQNCFGKIDCRR